MRQLPGNSKDSQWQSSIIKDLSFIKKHLRYPFSARTLSSAIIMGLLLAFVSRLAMSTSILSSSKKHYWFEPLFISALILFPLIIAVYRYLQSLRFISISTSFFTYENQQLLKKFLESQHLLIYRYPEAPEVFQIISRSVNPKDEDREVMVFIADDKRILINSHFIHSGFQLIPQSKNYKAMAKRLSEWLKICDLHIDNTNVSVRKSDVTL